jgi:hypothetical protein
MTSVRAAPVYIEFFYNNTINKKKNEFNLPTYTAFIDYINAFDMVKRTKLCQILALKGFPQHLIRAIQSIYEETNIMIKNGGRRSQKRILKTKEHDKDAHCHQCCLIYT